MESKTAPEKIGSKVDQNMQFSNNAAASLH